MYKFPIRVPEGWKLTITQGFHEKHNGNDVACGTGPMTYGLPIVWPFPWPGKPYDIAVNAPIGATKAHAQVDTVDPSTGIAYSLVYIHLSGAIFTQQAGEDTDRRFQQGDTIGFIGNNGAVRPLPTPASPFGGSHLHLGLGVKMPGEANYTMVDPSLYFDANDPYRGADDPTRDQPVYDWAAANGAPFRFGRDLWFGLFHQDVIELQKRLGVSPTYVGFGPKTLAAVIRYQKASGITPAVGYVGPKTRESLNAIFS